MRSVSRKICLLGDFAVGKTSLARRFVYDIFEDDYLSTIGVKVSRKTMAIPHDDEMIELTLMIWDLAGSERFNEMRATYMRGASGAILVCDLSRQETIENLHSYAQDMRSVASRSLFLIAANKCDIQGVESALNLVKREAEPLNAPCFITSAKTGDGVENMFRHLGRELVSEISRSTQ